LASTGAIGDLRNDTWQITTFIGTDAGSDDMHILSRTSNNEFGRGKVAEVLVYDEAFNETQRLQAVAYLNEKWFTEAAAVPEPSTFALGLLAVVGIGLLGRRGRRRS